MSFWQFADAHPWVTLVLALLAVCAMPQLSFKFRWQSKAADDLDALRLRIDALEESQKK